MAKPLIIEPEAEVDLAEAYAWYERQRSGLGSDLLLCIEAAFQSISDRPRSFPKIATTVRRTLVRRFPYLILYKEGSRIIHVLGIFHVKRDPRKWAERIEP